MARNRVIYQSQALFIAPSSTGTQVSGVDSAGTGQSSSPFKPESTGALASGISLLKKMGMLLHRIRVLLSAFMESCILYLRITLGTAIVVAFILMVAVAMLPLVLWQQWVLVKQKLQNKQKLSSAKQ